MVHGLMTCFVNDTSIFIFHYYIVQLKVNNTTDLLYLDHITQ